MWAYHLVLVIAAINNFQNGRHASYIVLSSEATGSYHHNWYACIHGIYYIIYVDRQSDTFIGYMCDNLSKFPC